MAWVQGMATGVIAPNGDITVEVDELQVIDGPRPKHITEVDADPDVFDRIRRRVPGEFRTLGFLGGATAIVVPTDALTWLPEPLMERLRVKYGFERWPEEALVMLTRNTAAPAIQNAAEPAGGMAEDTNLLLEQLKEIVEVGVHDDHGWVEFQLPYELGAHQPVFDVEQRHAWEIVRSRFPVRYVAPLELLPVGRDTFDGRRGVVTAGPVGDFSFLHLARLHLADGADRRLLDTEARPGNREAGEPEWVALRRTVMVVVPREGKSPIGFHFGGDGGLHPCGIHLALSGEAWEYNLTHLGRAAIEAMGWVPEGGVR
ncbi:hypothetical protein HY480_04015 [Candidatus Uhrbacteria bacterium]|nr:hypothetical protein [Candidatus Uhrbacteria bacterium]